MFKYKTKCIVVFFIALSDLLKTNARTQKNVVDICKTIRSQNHYSLNDMTGFWYGIEVLEHKHHLRPEGENCIKVDIKIGEKDHVYLKWRERDFVVNYTFFIEDNNQRGLWTSLGNQDVLEEPFGLQYEQFAGKVFVVRASDNLVLTFCSSEKVYTLVLSKNYTMNSTELESIHNSLTRFGVPAVRDKKRYCRNGAYNVQPENFLIIFISFVAFKIIGRYL